jgi:hypothetical protein
MARYVLKGKQAEGAFMKKPNYGIVPVLALAALGLSLGACQQSPAPAPVVNVQPASAPPDSPPPATTSVEHSATTSSSNTTTDPHDPNAPASTTTSTESKMSKKTTQ